jgi:hypothetical protein
MSVAADGSTEANLYFVPRGQNANESRHSWLRCPQERLKKLLGE